MEKILYDAALNNDVPTLIHLLAQDPNLLEGTNFNCKDKNPLHIAVMQGHLEFVQEILNHKGSFCLCLGRDRDGRNPLYLAAMYGKTSVLDVLIQAALPAALEKADGGGTILHLCVKYHQLEALKCLAPRLNDPQFLNAKNEDGMTILHFAIYYYQMKVLQEDPTLLGRANLNCKDKNAAATLGNEAFVQAILQANSSSTCYQMCLGRDRDGRNPVHLAVMYGQLNILNLLIHHDSRLIEAGLEKADSGGTILHLCVKHNQLEALKLLIKRFTDPEFIRTKNDDGMTVLHLAIYYNQNQNGREEMITYLIENTSTTEMVNIKNANGKTALDLVLEQGKIGLDKFLIVKGKREQLNHLLRDTNAVSRQILRSLAEAGALTGYEAMSSQEKDIKEVTWVEARRDAIMVVAALIATMAFQAMVSPPGGVWQEDSLEGPNPHRAGEAVMARIHPKYFKPLIRANTAAFVSSFSTIVVLIGGVNITSALWGWGFLLLSLVIWMSIAAIGITFALSYVTVAPDSQRGELTSRTPLIIIIIMTWSYALAMVAQDTYRMVMRPRRTRPLRQFRHDPAVPLPTFHVDPDIPVPAIERVTV